MLALDISDLWERKNSGPLPSCVYTKFREQFVSAGGIYGHFKCAKKLVSSCILISKCLLECLF